MFFLPSLPWFIEQWGKASAHCRASPCRAGSCHAQGLYTAHQPRSPSTCPYGPFSIITAAWRANQALWELPPAFPLHAEHSSLSAKWMQRVWSATWRHLEENPLKRSAKPKARTAFNWMRGSDTREERSEAVNSICTSIVSLLLQRGTGTDGIPCQTPKGFGSVNKVMRTWLP